MYLFSYSSVGQKSELGVIGLKPGHQQAGEYLWSFSFVTLYSRNGGLWVLGGGRGSLAGCPECIF